MKDRLFDFLCTSAYLGRIPRMPGTAGTLGGVALFLGLWALGLRHPAMVLGVGLGVAALGVALTPWAQARYGKSDPQQVVIDEVAGYFISVAIFLGTLPLWAVAGAGFLLFRIFDILKPPPIGWVDRMHNRWALVGDDVVAGLCASVCLHAVAFAVGGPRV